MKKFNVSILLFCIIPFFFSCNFRTSEKNISKEIYNQYIQKGDEISNLTQSVLLTNVGGAIQQGGPEFAIEFCNLKASSLVDSLNGLNNCVITRVSEKNRNPGNQLQNNNDKNIWAYFSEGDIIKKDTILANAGTLVYYKKIQIAMPACLKCHGNPSQDINQATLEKLQKLYPDDLATGYQVNDFRGLWKIEFTISE